MSPAELYEMIRQLDQRGLVPYNLSGRAQPRDVPPARRRGPPAQETGERVGIGVERVRQVLVIYFGLRGEPPAVKARRQRRNREAK